MEGARWVEGPEAGRERRVAVKRSRGGVWWGRVREEWMQRGECRWSQME